MEEEKVDNNNIEEDELDVPLPGFRFHPTDEELVGFYLRRKVEEKPFAIELLKEVDIYKYDPWDLPSSNVGDKEWYFFCKRGRKYRNSIRPNRVTSSGFWKATGIDRPIYSARSGINQCIGLKKSLVYYKGSAGKGTKTEWMMHEFRLPVDHDDKSTKHIDVKKIINSTREAEVWTLCRILKRNVSAKKCMPSWRELPTLKRNVCTPHNIEASAQSCSIDSDTSYEGYKIDFRTTPSVSIDNKNFVNRGNHTSLTQRSSLSQVDSATTTYSNFYYPDVNEIIKTGSWDELKSVAGFSVNPFSI